jgi:hypothetical protein
MVGKKARRKYAYDAIFYAEINKTNLDGQKAGKMYIYCLF